MAHNNGTIPRAPKKGNKRTAKPASENAAKFQDAVQAAGSIGNDPAIDPAYTAMPMTGLSEGNVAAFIPHRPARPEKSEGGRKFKLVSEYEPAGDQPTAITELV